MKSSGSNASRSSEFTSESDIPPPLDPFPTYQTPYSRNTSEHDNPFISFRRFADEQLSSFFSGLPRLLGMSSIQPATKQASADRSADLERLFSEQASRFETEITEMLRKQNENAEGFKKQLEQEWEERRRENENRLEEDDKRWEMLKRGLHAFPWLKSDVADPSTNSGSQSAEPGSASTYGANGIDRNEPATELDIYDQIEERVRESDQHQSQCPWARHRRSERGLGWDGKSRARKTPQSLEKDPIGAGSSLHHNEKILPRESAIDTEKALNPIEGEGDGLFHWLLTSNYSPIKIERPGWAMARWPSPDLPQCDTNNDSFDTDTPSSVTALDRKLAEHLPWTEAFADLLSSQQIAEMCAEEEMRKLEEQKVATSIQEEVNRLFHITRGLASAIQESVFGFPTDAPGDTDENDDQSSRNAEVPPVGRVAPSDCFGAHGTIWPMPEAVLAAVNYLERSEPRKDLSREHFLRDSGGNLESRSSVSSSHVKTEPGSINTVISTLTTTQIRTLPDGSTETRRVLKRRFADGYEESSESVETRPIAARLVQDKCDESSTSHKETQTLSEADGVRAGKGGWFWN